MYSIFFRENELLRPFRVFHEAFSPYIDEYCGYILFIHYRGGFFYVYGLGKILIVRLWTVEGPFSISVDSNRSLTVNILN